MLCQYSTLYIDLHNCPICGYKVASAAVISEPEDYSLTSMYDWYNEADELVTYKGYLRELVKMNSSHTWISKFPLRGICSPQCQALIDLTE